MGDIMIPVNNGHLPVFVAVPERVAPWPGVVVLHDVGGLKEDLRNQARWLAREGFLAAVPNLYFRGSMMKCVFAIARDMKARRGQTYEDIEAVRAWLVDQEGCTGQIGVIGFCMGGGIALLLAPGYGFGAASINYGGPLTDDAKTFLSRSCPIVGSYGARDRWNRGVAQKLERTLAAAGIAHDVKEYPDAGHSFLNNPGTWWFKALRIVDIGYDEPAAEDARRRIVRFFRQHLGGQVQNNERDS